MSNPLAKGRDGDRFHFTLTLINPADAPTDAVRLSQAITPFLAEKQIPSRFAAAVHTALEELLTNLGKFGRAELDPAQSAVLVASGEIVVEDGRIDFRLRDNGTPFDPTRQPPPVFTDDPETLVPGGLGLHMLRTMFTSCEYTRHDNHNTSLWRLVMEEKGE